MFPCLETRGGVLLIWRKHLDSQFVSPETPFKQMQVAAVTLLRENVISALRTTQPSFFTSTDFVRSFGPVIFRPQPPDLFDNLDLNGFLESLEPSRLIECLSLYYVVLLNDKLNRVSGLPPPLS